MNTRLNSKFFLKSFPFKKAVSFFVILSFLSSSAAQSAQLGKNSIITPDQLQQKNQKKNWSSWSSLNLGAPNNQADDETAPVSLGKKLGTVQNILGEPKALPKDPFAAVLTMDDILGHLSYEVIDLETNGRVNVDGLPADMMAMADRMTAMSDHIYADMKGMLSDVESMKAQVKDHFDALNRGEMEAQDLNSQSDEMAGQAAAMRASVGAMKERVQTGRDIIEDMFSQLDEMAGGGKDTLGYYDQFSQHIKTVTSRLEELSKNLVGQNLADKDSFNDVRTYLADLQKYISASKPYTGNEIRFVENVRKYLKNTSDYLSRVFLDVDKVETNLQDAENYFHSAKANGKSSAPVLLAEAPEEGNVCSGAKKEGLKTLDACQKSCHTVCRWKEDVAGTDCYECPSGSPDSCFDVGGWPANHPWCQPGGVCYDDPMMVCTPFGAVGPQLEKLQCTNCKKRPDMCWQNVGQDTTTYSVCKQNCWDGKCVFKGKYKEKEWDGKDETIHCFECKRPPPPPSCEDLGWGFSWKADCDKNCPDPGACEEETVPPRAQPGQINPGGKNDPNCGGGMCGGVAGGDNGGSSSGGSTTGGRTPTGIGGGTPANPPTGSPQQPSGGGGAQPPSGPSSGEPSTPSDEKKPDEPQQPPQAPGSTTVNPPAQPNSGDKPKPPDNPPQPPSNPDLEFYKKWQTEVRERMKSREDIINDPNEGDAVKEEAQRQLESMTKWDKYLNDRIKEEEDKDKEKQRQADEARAREEAWTKSRPKYVDYAEEARRRGEEWHLKRLKEATEALQTKVQEAKDVLTGRRDRINKITNEINQLKTEIQNIKEGYSQGRVNRDYADTLTREREKRIKELEEMRKEFLKKLAEVQKKLDEELAALKNEYMRRLWAVDKNAKRKAETERMDEYYERLSELRRREQARDLRKQTVDNMVKSLEGALAEAKANGDSSRVDELQRQIDNMKRGGDEWDATQQRQIDSLKEQIRDLEIRNMYEGVGPGSPAEMAKKLDEYQKIFEGKISDAQKAIEALENKGGTRSREDDAKLQKLKAQVNALNSAIDGINAKRDDLKAGNPLTAEERQRMTDSATRIAAGSMSRDADKSFLQLAGESIVEEGIHNMNPLVAAKKSLAFGWGMAKGVTKAVVGLVELGVEAVDTVGESVAVDLGYDDGGIFGTDNLDAINGAISTVGSNMNFDGVLKAVVAAGGAIDAKIKELEKSKDIDWDTSEFGGDVVGQTVAGDMVIAGALGKAGKALGWVDEAAEGVNAANKGLEAAEDAARAGSKVDDVSAGQRAASTVDNAPNSIPKESAPTRGPPVDNSPTVRDTFNPPPDETPTQVGGLRPAEDDIKTAVGGLKPEAPTVREGFNPGPVDETPTKIGGLNPGAADEAATKIGGLNPGAADEAATKVGGGLIDETDAATKVGAAEPIPPPNPPLKPTPAGVIGENSKLGFVDGTGRQVDVQTGEFIKSGSTSSVYVNGKNADQVVRITTIGGDVAEAQRLDEIGRGVVETIQKTDDRVRIATKFEGYTVHDPSSPLNNKVVEVVERAKQGDAKKVLEATGGTMTKGQAEAFDQATRAFNEKGYAWLDNHSGNYTFEPMPGGGPDDWRVVILDPGGIAPMKGATLAEKAENARVIQEAVNVPSADFRKNMEMFKNADPRFRDLPIAEQYQNIMAAHGDKIDVAAMGLTDPQQVQFNAGGLLKQPAVGELFTRTAEEAAAALKR